MFSKQDFKRIFQEHKTLIIIIGVLLLSFIFLSVGASNPSDEGKITAPISSTQLKGMNYQTAVDVFAEAGFTNIRLNPKYDVILGLLVKTGEIESVSINGYTTFGTDSKFNPSDLIIVSYHEDVSKQNNESEKELTSSEQSIEQNSELEQKPQEEIKQEEVQSKEENTEQDNKATDVALEEPKQEQEVVDDGTKIATTISYKDIIKLNWQGAQEILQNAGFTNIVLSPKYDIIAGIFSQHGDVYSVSIGGNSTFDATTLFEPNTLVVIQYHEDVRENPNIGEEADKQKFDASKADTTGIYTYASSTKDWTFYYYIDTNKGTVKTFGSSDTSALLAKCTGTIEDGLLVCYDTNYWYEDIILKDKENYSSIYIVDRLSNAVSTYGRVENKEAEEIMGAEGFSTFEEHLEENEKPKVKDCSLDQTMVNSVVDSVFAAEPKNKYFEYVNCAYDIVKNEYRINIMSRVYGEYFSNPSKYSWRLYDDKQVFNKMSKEIYDRLNQNIKNEVHVGVYLMNPSYDLAYCVYRTVDGKSASVYE